MVEKSESRIQQEIVQYYRNKYCTKLNNPRHLIFSVPNERSNQKEQMRMIATGLYSGVSDLIIVTPKNVTFVEIKDAIGKQSQRQQEFEQLVKELGYNYFLIRSLEDFIEIQWQL
jgi:hypothetical protein